MSKTMKWDDFDVIREDDVSVESTFTDEINSALERIGSGPDGDHLKQFLMKTMTRGAAPGSSPVRLSELEGERRFARLLFNRLSGTKHGARTRSSGRRSGNPGGSAE